MARPTKMTPENVKKLLDAVRIGTPLRIAVQYAGITDDTLTNWRRRSNAFSQSLKEAEAAALVGWLAKIEKAANEGAWQAAAWKAERRYPQDFGRTDRVEINIRHEAERLAAELGMGADTLIAEAERIVLNHAGR